MSTITRRDFLAGLAATAGVATLAEPLTWAAESRAKPKKGTDLVKLGRSGLETTVLGIGTGTNSGNQQRELGQVGFTKLVRHALERGIRYMDTADMYQMHLFIRLALDKVPRERYFIQTKTTARHPEVAKADVERFRRELRVDCLDLVLMHCMTQTGWPTDMRPVMDVLDAAKAKGRVRAVGFSCHGWEPLAASLEADWPDIQLVRINPFGDKMDDSPEKVAAVVKKAHQRGRGIIGMKIYGETGFGSKEKRLQSLKYVLGLGCVDCFTIGFTSTQQLDETLELIEQASS